MTDRSPIPPLRVLAAGSLKRAFADIATAFAVAEPGLELDLSHGAAGLLRAAIEAGRPFDLYASANMAHPRRLAAAGRARDVAPFARNSVVATVRAGLGVTTATLVAFMADPAIRLATSTPGADPSGDYADLVFEAIGREAPDLGAALEAKALRLVGGADSPPVPDGRPAAAWLIGSGQADVMLGYASHSARNLAAGGVEVVPLPDSIAPEVVYGLCLTPQAPAGAAKLAAFLLSQAGQAILARAGFLPIA